MRYKFLPRLTLALLVMTLFATSLSTSLTPRAVGQTNPNHGTSAAETFDPVPGVETAKEATDGVETHGIAGHGADEGHGEASHGGEEHGASSPFDPHAGTWINPLARTFSGEEAPDTYVDEEGETHIKNPASIKYDVFVVTGLIALALAAIGFSAGRKVSLRPEGKPHSLANMVEAAFDGFHSYLVSIMGNDLARKYTPLVGTFFFTILLCNWMGLIPGMVAPTANANIPIALAIVAFFATHVIAIKEVGVGSWFMHFVGEPKWLAFLNFPLHIIGEMIKPLSLAIRLLCNVFGEEMVILQLTLLAVGAMAILKVPIPFQLPMMMLGVFFGALQALVFSTLLAIYISILSTHHDDHGGHGHTEHVMIDGQEKVVGHPTQTSVA